MGDGPVHAIIQPVTINTILNNNGLNQGHALKNVMCKRALITSGIQRIDKHGRALRHAPDPATPTVAAPAPMYLAAWSMSCRVALVWN